MSRPVRFDERLLIDLSSIRAWYEAQQAGLGVRFVGAFYSAVASRARNPLACPLFKPFASRNIRHSLVPDFPYAFYFSVNEAEIFLFLIFHGARNPRQLHRAILRRNP